MTTSRFPKGEAAPTSAAREAVRAPDSIGYRIKLFSQIITRKFSDRLAPYDITPFHWLVLCCLWHRDGLPTSEIGDKLQQVGGTLTGVLDRMEERELIRRERDNIDRRVWRIWLTDAGKELENILPQIAADLQAETWQGVSDRDRELFSKLLDRAILNLT